jgi:hypothetical protein
LPIRNLIANGVNTAPTTAFVLHRTRLGKEVMKTLESIPNGAVNVFLIVTFHLSIGKECLTGIG